MCSRPSTATSSARSLPSGVLHVDELDDLAAAPAAHAGVVLRRAGLAAVLLALEPADAVVAMPARAVAMATLVERPRDATCRPAARAVRAQLVDVDAALTEVAAGARGGDRGPGRARGAGRRGAERRDCEDQDQPEAGPGEQRHFVPPGEAGDG